MLLDEVQVNVGLPGQHAAATQAAPPVVGHNAPLAGFAIGARVQVQRGISAGRERDRAYSSSTATG